MALNIAGFNIHPMDRWENRNTDNQFKIEGLTAKEWVDKGKGTYNEFWRTRDARISAGARVMFESPRQRQVFPMDVFALTVDNAYGSSLHQVADAMPQWDKLVDMARNKNGTMYGIDIETIGDIQHARDIFGITEIGISKINLADGVREVDGKSIVLGLNMEQQVYGHSLIAKYEHEGWSALTKTEQSTLKRFSMYRGDFETIFKKENVVDVGNILGTNKTYTIVDKLANASFDVEDMRQGIENLHKVYNSEKSNAKPESVLQDVISFINSQFDSNRNIRDGAVFYAANGKFDITGLRNYANMHGVSIDGLVGFDNQILDNVNIIRTVATLSGKSVSQWFKDTYGSAAGADIDSQLRVYGMRGSQLHVGGSDLVNEANILINEDVDIYEIYRDMISKYIAKDMGEQRQTQNLDGQVYYIHHGMFNKENAEEFAYIPNGDGRRTSANYAITEEFWTINTDKSGYVNVDGEDRYRLVLDNYAEQVRGDDVTSIVLTGSDAQEVKNRLDYMADRFTDKQVRGIAQDQQNFHYRDLGRREWDRLFSPSEILIDNKEEIGGFASIKKHLSTEQMISEWESRNGQIPVGDKMNSSAARKLFYAADEMSLEKAINDIESNGKTYASQEEKDKAINFLYKKYMPFKTDYDAQAYLGMRKRLQNESGLLQKIVDSVDGIEGSTVDKTIVARNIYNDVMEQMENEYKTINATDSAIKIMTDITGIDILTGKTDLVTNEPITSRINGYNQKTISNGLLRTFKKMSESDMRKSLQDLKDRGFIDDANKYINMIHDLDMTTESAYEKSLYFMTQDIGFEMADKFEDDYDLADRFGTLKNLQDSIVEKMERLIEDSDGHKIELNAALLEQEQYINDAITRHVKKAPKTVYMDERLTREQTNKLLENLGMEASNTNSDLIVGMFTGGRKNKPYGISNHKGTQSFLVNQGEGKSAYMFVTRDQDAQKLYQALVDEKYDFSSFADLVKSGADEFGAFYELPHINKYDIGDGRSMATMYQGKTLERFLVPKLEMRQYYNEDLKKKVTSLYLNDADFTVLSMYRSFGESFMNFVDEGKYSTARIIGRRAMNNHLQDMPTSATYRHNGQARIMHPGPNDFMYGRQIYAMEGLEDIFKHMVTGKEVYKEKFEDLNIAQQIVKSFADRTGMEKYSDESYRAYLNRVMDDDMFKQFFRTRMTIGTVEKDALHLTIPGTDEPIPGINMPMLEIIRKEALEHGDDYGFDKTVKEAFDKIPHASLLNQIGSESAVEKGALFDIIPGEYSLFSGLFSTMRPVYVQQFNNITYDAKTMEEQAKKYLVGLSTSEFDPVTFGHTPIEASEHISRQALKGQGIMNVEERTFMAKFKFMSDFQLQQKLITLESDSTFRDNIKSKFGISDDTYSELLEYAKANMFSFHEDKGLHAPGLRETDLLKAKEAMTYSINLDMLDKEKTKSALEDIVGSGGIVGTDDIIAYRKNGNAIFYNGPQARLTAENIDDLMYNDGVTKLMLTKGGVIDNKFMLNSSEKFTSHTSMDASRIEQIANIAYEKAIELGNMFHGYVFDGALFALNPKSAKHGGDHTSVEEFLVIQRQYERSGNAGVFVKYLNNLIKDEPVLSQGLSEFKYEDGRIVGNTASALHGSRFIRRILSDVIDNANKKTEGIPNGLIRDIDKRIVEELNEMQADNTLFGVVSTQNMTEFVGKKYRMDQRTDQSMRMRGMKYSFEGGAGVTDVSARIADDMRQYSTSYEGKGTGLSDAGYTTLQGLVDALSAAKNDERIRYNKSTDDMQRTVGGIIETVNNMDNPISSKDLKRKNIVSFDIAELIDPINLGTSGATTDELQTSIFFINGEPSKLLRQKAEQQGKNLDDRSFSIFINMGREFNIRKDKTTDGFLIPIQSINGSVAGDKHYFQNQQKETISFINKIVRTISSPSKDGFANLVSYYKDDYLPAIRKELNYMKKDADITKAFQEYIVPTSTYMLGQDETSPLLESQMGKDWQEAVNNLYEAERELQKKFDDNAIIKKYTDALDKFNKRITEDANAIDNLTKFSQYQALSSGYQKRFGDALTVIDVNGIKHHGIGISASQEALERSGFDFGSTAMNLVADMEKMAEDSLYNGSYEDMVRFNQLHRNKIEWLKNKINESNIKLGVDEFKQDIILNIDNSRGLMEQLEDVFGDAIKDENWQVTAKTFNQEIAKGKNSGFLKVLGLFKESGIAQDYMSEVGTYGQFLRSPIFRSQLVTKVFLDKNLEGFQVRALDAVISLITNLDFDGDVPALLQRLNGTSIMKNTEQAFKDYASEWSRFAIENHHHLLADLIRDGAPFRREMSIATRYQQSSLLKIVNKEAYNQGIQAFLNKYEIFDNGIRVTSLESVSGSAKKAIELAAGHSDVMSDMFENTLGNTLRDENMTLAAYAARIRKKYIGSVSTPAYKLRSTLMDAYYSKELTQEQKNLVNDVIVGMSNMFSQRGGFLNANEQLSIDTKWAKDAIRYSQLSDWAGAMSNILRNKYPNKIRDNVRSMIEAVGTNVFGISSAEEYDAYTNLIMNVDSEVFKKAYRNAKESGGEFNFTEYTRNGVSVSLERDQIQELWAMHDLVEAINKVPKISEIFKERYDGDSFMNFIKKIPSMSEKEFAEIVQQTLNTPVHDVVHIVRDAMSKETFDLEMGKVYFDTGSFLDDKPNASLYMYKGGGKFLEVNPDESVISVVDKDTQVITHSNTKYGTGKEVSLGDRLKEIFVSQTESPMISELRHDESVQAALQKNIEVTMMANTLDKIILDDSGAVRSHEWGKFRHFISQNWQEEGVKRVGFGNIDKGNATIDKLSEMFYTQDVYDEMTNLANAYDYAVVSNTIDDSLPQDSASLIRQLNRQIAEEGWQDMSGIGIIPYDVTMRPHIVKAMGGESNYQRYLKAIQELPGFNFTEYLNTLDSLRNRAYDISTVRNGLMEQYDRPVRELEELTKQGYTNEELQPIVDFLESTTKEKYVKERIDALRRDNIEITSEAESKIYKMFGNVDQFNKHFKLDGDSADEMRVGFGELMGFKFSDLSRSDIDHIMSSSLDEYMTDSMDDHTKQMLQYSMERTKENLSMYSPKTSTSAFDGRFISNTAAIDNARAEMSVMLGSVLDAHEANLQAAAEASRKAAAETMEQQTLRTELFTNAREVFSNLNINKGTIGIAVGALAALGIVNNVIHNEKPQSPLKPARTSKNNNEPYLNNDETQYQAPPSPQKTKTIYHHNGTGLNFKVSAKTKRDLDDQSRAKLISRAGGGQPSIHTYADTSGISNNWLQNKFAELMN